MKPVLICGGGIGGLSLASALKKCKIPFLILEQAKNYDHVGGGIGLWGPALKILRQLSLEASLTKRGRMMVCAGYRNFDHIDSGKWLVRPSTSTLNRHTSCLCLHRFDLQSTLLSSLSPDMIRMSSKVSTFNSSPGEGVHVKLVDGTIIEGSLLVGADGINSIIRQQLFPEVVPRPCGYQYWQGIGQTTTATVEFGYDPTGDILPAYEAWAPGARFGVVALKYPENFWFFCSDNGLSSGDKGETVDDNEKSEMLKEGLLQDTSVFGNHVKALVESTPENRIFQADLKEVPVMKAWSKGRVVCLGDAVHGMAPNLAQGACLSMEDSMELAHQLHTLYNVHHSTGGPRTTTPTDVEVERALHQYTTARYARTRTVQLLVPRVHQVGSLHGVFATIRNGIFSVFPEFVKTFVFEHTHQAALGWAYTVPNLGQGLYHRLLDEAFLVRNSSLFDFHRGDVDRVCSGSVTVTAGTTVVARILRKMMQLPPPMTNGKVILNVATDTTTGSEQWSRQFIGTDPNTNTQTSALFCTKQYIVNEQLAEQFGLFEFLFDVISEEHEFQLILRGLRIGIPGFCTVPTPKWTHPVVQGLTRHHTGKDGWEYCVSISAPSFASSFIGMIVKYEGFIDNIHR